MEAPDRRKADYNQLDVDPLLRWKPTDAALFPLVAAVARSVLAVQVSSSASERSFNNNTVTNHLRRRLLVSRAGKMIMMKHNFGIREELEKRRAGGGVRRS